MLRLTRKIKKSAGQWYRLQLDREALAAHTSERVQLLFSHQFLEAHQCANMRLWLAQRSDGGADLYLSPAAEPFTTQLRADFGAQPCTEPALTGLILLEGDLGGAPTAPRSRWPRRIDRPPTATATA